MNQSKENTMLIRTPKSSEIKENQVTDEHTYQNRRQILKSMGFLGASALMVSPHARAINWFGDDETKIFKTVPLNFSQPDVYQSDDTLPPEQKVISHNNFMNLVLVNLTLLHKQSLLKLTLGH